MNSSMPTYDGGSGHNNRNSRLFVSIVFLVVAMVVVMQVLVPVMAASRIADSFKADWEMTSTPEVTVKALPFYKIWRGQMDELKISAGKTYFDDILVDEWEITLSEVLVQNQGDGAEDILFESGVGSAYVSETALQEYIEGHSGNILNPKLIVFADYIHYGGEWESGIIDISFSVRGYPYIHETGDIRLELESITVGPFDIPGMIREITESFVVQLFPEDEEFMFAGMKISEIELSEGFVRIDFSSGR